MTKVRTVIMEGHPVCPHTEGRYAIIAVVLQLSFLSLSLSVFNPDPCSHPPPPMANAKRPVHKALNRRKNIPTSLIFVR